MQGVSGTPHKADASSGKSFLLGLSLSLILAFAAGLYFINGAPQGLAVDDAYIHLVYADNLAKGQGLAFNEGEPSFGTTSPLWVLVCSTFAAAEKPDFIVRLIAGFLLILSSGLVFAMTWHELADRAAALSGFERLVIPVSAAGLFSLSGNMLWICFCGMETILFLFLGLAAIYFMTKKEKPSITGGIALGLLVAARPTGALLGLILLVSRIMRYRRLKELWPFALAVCVYAPFGIYFLAGTGRLFPSTMGGKLASDLFNAGFNLKAAWAFIERHLHYLYQWDSVPLVAMLIGLIFFSINFFLSRSAGRPKGPSFAAIALVWAAANIIMHSLLFRSTYILTPYHNLRYQAMLFPASSIICACALGWFAGIIKERRQGAWLVRFSIVAVMAAGLILSAHGMGFWKSLYKHNISHLDAAHRAAALWAKSNLPQDSRLACFDIGSLKYFSRLYVIDLGGLVDPDIHPYLRDKRTGEYLVKKRATHYLELVRHSSERITGVRKDEGRLYELKELARFESPAYKTPVFLHSLGVVIYEIKYLEGAR